MDGIQEEIWGMILEMNRKWTVESNADGLSEYFHKDMVAITPTARKRIEGGEKCVANWKNFTENARIHFWKESEPEIHVYGRGKFAIVTYYFDMSYGMNGRTITMKGRDMFSLVNEKGKWLAVANQFSPFPSL